MGFVVVAIALLLLLPLLCCCYCHWFVVTYATSFCHDGLFRPYRGMQLRRTRTTKMARGGGLDKGKLTKEKKEY
jgi:hypothetical protein